MKNKDWYILDNPEQTDSNQNWFDSLEETIMNIVTSVGFIIALVLLAVNVEAAPNSDSRSLNNRVTLSDVNQGSLLFRADDSKNTSGERRYSIASSLKTNVNMKVSGMVVRTTVIQHFKNETISWQDGIYVFPLPETAAVDHMKIRIGERSIEGKIKERTEAKRIYTKAKNAGKKTALIAQLRPNMFTNSIANIAPGETVIVEIEYQQVLKFDNGSFKLRFPTTLTPRYTAKSAFKFQSELPPINVSQENATYSSNSNNVTNIKVELNAGFPVSKISSSYHKIKSVMHLEGRYTVSLINTDMPGDRDFELIWIPELGNNPKAAVFRELSDLHDYFLVMIMPPMRNETTHQVLARDVTYIIDTSGSMYGESIRQAKLALQLAISRLRPSDRFNIIEFNSLTNKLFSESRDASTKNIFIATKFVERLTANGGTEMKSALQAAFDSNKNSEFIKQIIFLTDGSVGNEDELFNLIKSDLGNNRLFTVAIGSSPNSFFMTKAASYGRGTYTYIGKISEVNQKMSALFSKLEKPVMQDLKLNWSTGVSAEVWPTRLPDLYAGEPLIFTARITSENSSNKTPPSNPILQITGKRNVQEWNTQITLETQQSNVGIAVLWARNKIVSLMDAIRQYRTNSSSEVVKSLKQKIIKLALGHHLVSKYTSLVAVESTPTRPVFEGLKVARVANSVPRGRVARHVIQGQYAQTATSALLNLIIGFILLVFYFVLLKNQKVFHGFNRRKFC